MFLEVDEGVGFLIYYPCLVFFSAQGDSFCSATYFIFKKLFCFLSDLPPFYLLFSLHPISFFLLHFFWLKTKPVLIVVVVVVVVVVDVDVVVVVVVVVVDAVISAASDTLSPSFYCALFEGEAAMVANPILGTT